MTTRSMPLTCDSELTRGTRCNAPALVCVNVYAQPATAYIIDRTLPVAHMHACGAHAGDAERDACCTIIGYLDHVA